VASPHGGARSGLRPGSGRATDVTTKCTKDGSKPGIPTRMSGADLSGGISGKAPSESQPSSRIGENPPYGMRGGIEETSASCEARYAPRSYPTASLRADPVPCERWGRWLIILVPSPAAAINGRNGNGDVRLRERRRAVRTMSENEVSGRRVPRSRDGCEKRLMRGSLFFSLYFTRNTSAGRPPGRGSARR
jgi:hypothetical protein